MTLGVPLGDLWVTFGIFRLAPKRQIKGRSGVMAGTIHLPFACRFFGLSFVCNFGDIGVLSDALGVIPGFTIQPKWCYLLAKVLKVWRRSRVVGLIIVF